jgi:phosphoglycolate phosphatase-like HAD superfamily hydrolase
VFPLDLPRVVPISLPLATALEARPRYVNAAFTAHEVKAITTAQPTPEHTTSSAPGPPAAATFVGDSVTDIEAARAAHTMSIDYTNKPSKTAKLMTAGADTVISTPTTLTEQIM